MTELHNLPLLNAKQEVALAQEIETLEVAHWRALLSYRRAYDVLDVVLEQHLEARAPKLASAHKAAPKRKTSRTTRSRSSGTSAVAALAQRLRELDATRTALHAADAAVRDAFADEARAEVYLARVARAREAEQRAKGRFVAANLRLVISMARRYDRSLLPLADLIQEGNLGLMHAVERYDYRRGYRFSTYATWWIRHNLNRALSDKGRLVRIPVHALDDLARIARAGSAAKSATGIAPTVEQIANELGLSEEKVATLQTAGLTTHAVSLDRVRSDDGEQTLHDLIAEPDETDPVAALDLTRWGAHAQELLAALPRIEAAILRYRFGFEDGEELTLRAIGQKYNLSRERIRQLQEEALTKLREAMRQSQRPGDDLAA